MISADDFYLDKSYQPFITRHDFSDKEYVFIEDLQRGTYAGGQNVSFDLNQLGLTNKYSNWEEGFVTIPLVGTVHCPNAVGNAFTAELSNAYIMSLKNGYHQLINSLKVSISNNEIVNTQTLHNLKIHYDILSSWSDADVKTIGGFMNFCGPDNPESEEYYSAANSNGLGCCNNRIVSKDPGVTWSPHQGYGAFDDGNTSRRLRMQNTSFDISTANGNNSLSGTFINNNALSTIGKNYVLNSISTAALVTPTEPIVYYIVATIPLKEIHSIFKNLHLTKNMYMKLEFNFNTNFTTLFTFTAQGNNPTYASFVNSGAPPCCPYVISPIGTALASSSTNVTGLKNSATQVSFQTQLQIGKATISGYASTYQNPIMTACRIYVPLYTMSPSQEEKYLSSIPEKTIIFEDHSYSNTSLSAIQKDKSVLNAQLFSSMSRVRGILLIPLMSSISATGHGGALNLGSPLLSPFSGCGTVPYGRVSNFNVLINGRNHFSQNVNYGWEMYYNEVMKSKGTIFGNAMSGLKSGLLDQHTWETNHCYVFVDLSRWESIAEDNAPKNIGLQFTNSSNVTCDYHCFLMYEKEITVNTSTGMLVKKS